MKRMEHTLKLISIVSDGTVDAIRMIDNMYAPFGQKQAVISFLKTLHHGIGELPQVMLEEMKQEDDKPI